MVADFFFESVDGDGGSDALLLRCCRGTTGLERYRLPVCFLASASVRVRRRASDGAWRGAVTTAATGWRGGGGSDGGDVGGDDDGAAMTAAASARLAGYVEYDFLIATIAYCTLLSPGRKS